MKKLICLIFLFLVACGPSPEEMFKTAEFEMLQTNYSHAEKLYQNIIEKHPKSELAEKARVRLEEIKIKTEND